jgi:hypothetical protein
MPAKIHDTPDTVMARFVEPEPMSGCWLWTGAQMKAGYGGFRRTSAHAWMYNQAKGPVPTGHDLHHTCRMRSCVNPSHLIILNRREHNGGPRITHCKRGHAMEGQNVYRDAAGYRQCRACYALRPSRLNREAYRAYQRRYWRAHKAEFQIYRARWRAKQLMREVANGNE